MSEQQAGHRCPTCGGENGHHFQTCINRAPAEAEEPPAGSSAFDSTSDQRVTNNVMRHEYRPLSETEKYHMQRVKDLGLEFHEYLESIGKSREIALAKTNLEQAVMWAVKHITG